MDAWTSELAAAAEGRVVGPDVVVREVVIDDREANQGSLFAALGGSRTDGHRFVRSAFARGASAALVSTVRFDATASGTQVVVVDVAEALLALGAWWRAQLDASTIAITGSVGKTTTKDLAAAVLSESFGRVVASPGSFNNQYGVPITILSAERTTEALVCEVGAGVVGEIASLCEIVRPRVGVVTAVGPAHVETFGSIERIAEGKGELVRSLPADGIAILNADDPVVAGFASATTASVTTFGRTPAATARARCVSLDRIGRPSFTVEHEGSGAHVSLRLVGGHMVTVALAAIACGLAHGIPLERAAAGVERVAGSPGRMQLRLAPGRITIVDDSYNANPLSMRAALEALAVIGHGCRKVAVLGDMLELGDSSCSEHRRLGRAVVDLGVDRLVTVGREMLVTAEAAWRAGMSAPAIRACDDVDEATPALRALVRDGDVVLVKGSRACRLDGAVSSLLAGDQDLRRPPSVANGVAVS
jgi:UDP-N-acetylmuramoyl-tripeptide--D-alanyl-D-alanine ligase